MAPLINSSVEGREPYILPRQEKAYRHKLDIGENMEPICPEVERELVARNVHLYPAHDRIYDELRLSVQNYCGVDPQKDNVIFTNGSDNALKAVIECYFVPNSKLLIPIPTYPHFVEFARNAKTTTNTIHFLQQNDVDLPSLQKKLRFETFNLCYLCSPNLPLGYSFTVHQLYELLNEFKDTMFVVDEAYIQYTEAYQAVRQAASAATLIERFTNIVVTRTFSKAFGLAGLRIGWLLSHPDNIRSLQVLVNHKSVTSLAMRAASQTIQQLPYYNAQITKVQELKDMLRSNLNLVCNSQTEIYGYNISGGNYFLLYAKSTKVVCQIFAQHGIYLRDKSAEIPNAIRSCIGTEKQMREVLLLVAFINLKPLFRCADEIQVVIDLDNTLRNGSKISSPWYSLDPEIVTKDWIVCTNNSTQTPNEFQQLVQQGMGRAVKEVVSPLTYFGQNTTDPIVFVIGSASVRDFFHYSEDPAMVTIVLVTQIPSREDIVKICKFNHEYGIPVFHTDSTEFTDLKSCAESMDCSEHTTIPDLGTYMQIMNVNSTCIDKASGVQNYANGFTTNTYDFANSSKQVFVIGDSIVSDRSLAKSIDESIFIRVDSTLTKPQCDLDHMYISIPHIGFL